MSCALWHRETPVGEISLLAKDGALCALEFDTPDEELIARFAFGEEVTRVPVEEIDDCVRRYFAGEVHAVDGLKVRLEGTPFQREVWAALRRIPAGETWTYARLAREVGRPKAMRAVGAANGQNPIAVVVPCHRVIATGGKLGGYAGGLERKVWLLGHEKALLG